MPKELLFRHVVPLDWFILCNGMWVECLQPYARRFENELEIEVEGVCHVDMLRKETKRRACTAVAGMFHLLYPTIPPTLEPPFIAIRHHAHRNIVPKCRTSPPPLSFDIHQISDIYIS